MNSLHKDNNKHFILEVYILLTELNLSLKMKAPLELISKSKVLFDPSLEFNAPKYCDLSSLHDLTVMDIINIDPWFRIEHPTNNIHHKKKHSQYEKENTLPSSISIRKKKESASLSVSLKNLSLNKTFKVSVSKQFNKISKVKRGVSTDTYKYYANKEKKITKIKITYCPRIHNDKVMKKWEEQSGENWYLLSPESRQKANEEMSKMIKNEINK